MCGKASVSHLSWRDIYAWANLLSPPDAWPEDPATRINISPSRRRRKAEPDTTIWETLPITITENGTDRPTEAVWPFLPPWSRGQLPYLKNGKLLSTANARLRHDGDPFAKTFMQPWNDRLRVVVWVSWFYEFDAREKPQVPYAVFPLERAFWPMAGLASRLGGGGEDPAEYSVAVITVDPNRVLRSVGHHRSPALLQSAEDVATWLHGRPDEALALLRPHPDETMGVEAVPMGVKIPGNEDVELPEALMRQHRA